MNENYKVKLFASFVFGVVAGVLTARYYYKKEADRYWTDFNDAQDYADSLEAELMNIREENGVPSELVYDGHKDKPIATKNENGEFEIRPGVFVTGTLKTAPKVTLEEALEQAGLEPVESDEEDDLEYIEIEDLGEDAIYIIPRKVFFEGDVEQITLSYYPEDEVLLDSNSEPVPNIKELLGEEFSIEVFGRLSGDDKVVYIRNEKISVDFEIVLEDGSYIEDVLGYRVSEDTTPVHHNVFEDQEPKVKKSRPKKVKSNGEIQ